MSFFKMILIGIGVVFVFILILFPEARGLFSGFVRLFIKDMATTPEGAEAIYGEKIDSATEAYSRADDMYKKAQGRLSITKKELELNHNRLKKVEAECEALYKEGKIDSARIMAEQREELVSDIAREEELVRAYAKAASEAKEAVTECEARLRRLRRESRETVENMKVKQQLKEVYDDMDDLKATTGTDKLLDSIREKNKDLDAIVEGSRASHDNKLSTKVRKAEAEARKLQAGDYMAELEKKYGKKK